MHTGLLFHKRHLQPQQSDHSRWPYRFNAVLLKEDFQGERELSPWSSDQFKSSGGTRQQYRTITPQKFIQSFHQESSLVPQSIVRYKGKSVELKPQRDNSDNPISKDFFNLLKLQSKQRISKPQMQEKKVRNLKLNTIDMSLGFEDLVNPSNSAKTNNFEFADTFLQETTRQQPIKVKISKQMKQRYHNFQAQIKAESDRSFHVDHKDKSLHLNISDLRPRYLQRIKKKAIQSQTLDTQKSIPQRPKANTLESPQSPKIVGTKCARKPYQVSNSHKTVWHQ